MAQRKKIDSNETELSFAEESDVIGVLPTTPIWYPLEPNSYDSFGGETTLKARNPINASRQRKKGSIVDLDASGGINQDFTQRNTQKLLQGFMFADFREKGGAANYIAASAHTFTAAGTDIVTDNAHGFETGYGPFTVSNSGGGLPAGLAAATPYWIVKLSVNTYKLAANYANAVATVPVVVDITTAGTGTHTITRKPIVIAADDGFTVNNEAGILSGSLVLTEGFANAANNGLHLVSSVFAGFVEVTTTGLVDEANPPAGATLTVVGYQFDATEISVNATGGEFGKYVAATADFTDYGLIPGEWIFVGGDVGPDRFTLAANNGIKRIRTISEDGSELTIDQSEAALVDEAGTALTISMFFGRVLKNELGDDIVRRSYQLERKLGKPETTSGNFQAEYVIAAVPNELVMNTATADFINCDLSFVGIDVEQRPYTLGLKAGTRVSLGESDAFNTSSDIKYFRMSIYDPTTEAPSPFFAYLTDIKFTLNNNLTVNKAVAVLGGFDVTAGTFEVSGELEAYFIDVEAIQAVRTSPNVCVAMFAAKDNAGFVLDLPLVALGDGRANVEQDNPIKLPLGMDAATAVAINPETDYTAMWVFFDYLPNQAM